MGWAPRELVRDDLAAFFSGDLERARSMVTPGFTYHLTDRSGRPATVRGFDAVTAWTRHEAGVDRGAVRYRILDMPAGRRQVAVVFDEEPPIAPGVGSQQLALWGFRGRRIASVRVFAAPASAGPSSGQAG